MKKNINKEKIEKCINNFEISVLSRHNDEMFESADPNREDASYARTFYKKARSRLINEINRQTAIPDWMIIDSFRYTLGRRSYQVGITCDWLVDNWKTIPKLIKDIIERELEQEFTRDDKAREAKYMYLPLGSDCDRQSWGKVRNCYKKTKLVNPLSENVTFQKLSGIRRSSKSYKSDEEILKDIKIDILKDEDDEPIYEYINWKNIPDNEKKEFGKWMNGQTTGVAPDGQSAIYVCDYLRWKRGLPVID